MSTSDNFVEQLIIKAIPDIDDEGLDLMVEDTLPVLDERVLNHFVEKLTDAQLKEYMKLMKKNASEEELNAYLNKIIPNYDDFIQKVYLDFETMYLKEFKNFQQESQK